MLCPNCGKEIKQGNTFCTSCGHKVIKENARNNNISKGEKIFVIIGTIFLIGFAIFLLKIQGVI